MEIETEVIGNGILVIKLKGRMQLKDLQEIESRFRKHIKTKQSVIVDLSGLEVLFSMALRALIVCAQSVQLRGGRFALVAPTENILTVLKASGVTKLMHVCASRLEAVAVVSV